MSVAVDAAPAHGIVAGGQRAALARAHHVPRPRHVSRAWETSPLTHFSAAPQGYRPTRNGGRWWAALRENWALGPLRADTYRTTVRVAQELLNRLDPATGRIHTVWATIAARLGISRSTVARAIARLKRARLLGVAASGRSARYSPKGRERTNLGPVYVLLLPHVPAPVEEHDTPSVLTHLGESSRKRAGAKITYSQRAHAAYVARYRDHRQSLEQKHVGLAPDLSSKRAQRAACRDLAYVLQHHCIDLRSISTRAIAAETTDFLTSGWTVADILTALDRPPHGAPYTRNGAGGMRSIQAWLRLRLAQWRDEHGHPLTSPNAARAAERAATAAERAAERAATVARRPRIAAPDSPAKRAALRAAKILRYGEATARHQFPHLFTD